MQTPCKQDTFLVLKGFVLSVTPNGARVIGVLLHTRILACTHAWNSELLRQ